MTKDQEICWQDNSKIYRRMWIKNIVTNLNYWSTVKPKYGFASPYSKVGAVEGRSIVMSSKDFEKEKVCERIFKLGLKHFGVWKSQAVYIHSLVVGQTEEAKNEGKLLWKPKEQRNSEKRKEKEENIGTVVLNSSLELSGIVLTEKEHHSVANWGWGQEDLVSCWADSKQFDIVGVCKHRRIVALHLEEYQWMGGGAAPGRSGNGRGSAGFFIQKGFQGNTRERKEWRMPNSTWVELVRQSFLFIISIVYLPPGGTMGDFKVTLAIIKKRILDVVK
ncbi:hypothetical protein QOT17_017806 [Balamuthia mandrillaris]